MPAITSATHHSVLLVEEYDALGVAIRSALRKFAPHHTTQMARSLKQAHALAQTHKPELVIVDFDPPHPGAISFFEELQTASPESRVLVIAADATADFADARGCSGALQFLEKPFEVVDFGAAVQALLGPWTETGTSRGTVRDLAVADAAALLCLAGATLMLHVHTTDNHNGQLYIGKGQIIHAVSDNSEGERALVEMLSWRNMTFSEVAAPSEIPKTIAGPWAGTLAHALRQAKKRTTIATAPIGKREVAAPPAAPAQKTGAKILVIDDTEMLLTFVEDSLALAEPSFQITTALNGLHGLTQAGRIVPDLILVDYVLPDIKGDEVCRRIASNPTTRHIPLIMMSGHVPEMTAAAEKLPNVVATLAKPFLSQAMLAVVRRALKEGPRPGEPAVITPQKKSTGFVVRKELAGNTKGNSSGAVGGSAGKTEANLPAPPHPKFRNPPPSDATMSAPGSVSSVPAMPEILRPQMSSASQPPRAISQPITGRPPTLAATEVLLDLPLDVVSMQFDSSFQIGSIRARPASPTVAIEIPALAARTALPLVTGFLLGPIDLDAHGRISIVRLIPTMQPFQVVATGTAFEIGGVTIVPANERERLQLLSAAAPKMTMQLFAPLELESVEFSARLDVRQLVLRCRGKAVRVTLNSESSSTRSGASFETTAVSLDERKRIRELTLTLAPVS